MRKIAVAIVAMFGLSLIAAAPAGPTVSNPVGRQQVSCESLHITNLVWAWFVYVFVVLLTVMLAGLVTAWLWRKFKPREPTQ